MEYEVENSLEESPTFTKIRSKPSLRHNNRKRNVKRDEKRNNKHEERKRPSSSKPNNKRQTFNKKPERKQTSQEKQRINEYVKTINKFVNSEDYITGYFHNRTSYIEIPVKTWFFGKFLKKKYKNFIRKLVSRNSVIFSNFYVNESTSNELEKAKNSFIKSLFDISHINKTKYFYYDRNRLLRNEYILKINLDVLAKTITNNMDSAFLNFDIRDIKNVRITDNSYNYSMLKEFTKDDKNCKIRLYKYNKFHTKNFAKFLDYGNYPDDICSSRKDFYFISIK